MRKSLLFLVVLAFAIAAPAHALAANVTITIAGFIPSAVTIDQGDSITWTNTDTANHQLISDKGGFSSPILKTGDSYSFTFKAAGTFPYKDALEKKSKQLKGTVVVKAAPAPAASVTLAASTLRVVYGGSVTLSGTVSSKQPGEKVTLLAQKYGDASPTAVTTLDTGSGGSWSYAVKPTIGTGYQARLKNATSSTATVGVRPRVSFAVNTGARFSTRVVAARSFAGRYVQFQRRSSLGQWVTVKRVLLNANSAAIFRATLPHGTSSLRIAMSINQAGTGYLGGISRTIVYHLA